MCVCVCVGSGRGRMSVPEIRGRKMDAKRAGVRRVELER